MAQSGVLRMPRVQLIRGLARTMKTANLSADSRQTVPQVSSSAGRRPGVELIPSFVKNDPRPSRPSWPGLSRPSVAAPAPLAMPGSTLRWLFQRLRRRNLGHLRPGMTMEGIESCMTGFGIMRAESRLFRQLPAELQNLCARRRAGAPAPGPARPPRSASRRNRHRRSGRARRRNRASRRPAR